MRRSTHMAGQVACCALLLSAGAARAEAWPELASPAPGGGGENDAALVLGAEDYAFVPDVPGARQNARDFYAYLTRTRGIPPSRATLLLDAEVTDDAIREHAAGTAAKVKPGGTLWLVYIGHGAPAEDGKDGVLVGADAQQTVANLYRRSVRQSELLALLAKGRQRRTVVILDACFSGRGATGAALVEGLQPLLPVAAKAPAAGTLVLTAGAANEFAGPLAGAARPAFSYLVLGALRGWGDRNADGAVTAEEAVIYAREAIAATVKDRRQTPELSAANAAEVLAKGGTEKGPDLVAMVLGGAAKAPPPDVPGGPTIKRGTVTSATGDLTVDAKPRELVRLELTDPAGKTLAVASPYKNPAAAPGTWKVVARAAGHEVQSLVVQVPPDETTLAKLELKPLGGLKVTGTPAGAAVKISGPGGFADTSGLPWEASGLPSGSYRVEVTRDGYDPLDRLAEVRAGETATVSVALPKKGTAATLVAAGWRGGTAIDVAALRETRANVRRARQRPLLVTELQHLETLLKQTPKNAADRPNLLHRLAETYAELAATCAREVRDEEARGANDRSAQARKVLLAARKQAIAHAATLTRDHPTHARLDEVLHGLAFDYELAGDLSNARSVYYDLIKRHPTSRLVPHAYLAFAELFAAEAAGDPSKLPLAEQAYAEVVKYPAPQNGLWAYARFRLAELAASRGELALALTHAKHVRAACEQHPKLCEAGALASLAARKTEEWTAAKR